MMSSSSSDGSGNGNGSGTKTDALLAVWPRAHYKVSALGRAALTLGRAWRVLVPVVVAQAAIQAVIVAFPYSPTQAFVNVATSALSAVVLLAAILLVTVAGVSAVDGRVTWRGVTDQWRTTGVRSALWLVLLVVAASFGLALWTWPGVAWLALTPFVVIASIAGEKNPFVANFRVIAARFWRWLATATILTTAALVSYLVFGFTQFFLRGFLGSFVIWMLVGIGFAWAITAWALIFSGAQKAHQASA